MRWDTFSFLDATSIYVTHPPLYLYVHTRRYAIFRFFQMIFEGIRRAVLSPSFLNEDMRSHLDSAFERIAEVCLGCVFYLFACLCLFGDFVVFRASHWRIF